MTAVDSRIQKLLDGNRKIAEAWPTLPNMEQMRAMPPVEGGAFVIRKYIASSIEARKERCFLLFC